MNLALDLINEAKCPFGQDVLLLGLSTGAGMFGLFCKGYTNVTWR